MSIFKKIISGICAVAVAVSLTACGEDTAWACKIDGKEVKAGIYINYIVSGYQEATNKLSDEGITEDLWNQQVEGKSMSDFVKDYAIQKTAEFMATEKKFDEMGLSFTETEIKAMKIKVDNSWTSYEEFYTSKGISKQSFYDISLNDAKNEKIFNAYYDADGISPVSDEEIYAFMKKTYAPVNFIPVSLKDEDGNPLDDTAKAAKIKEAEELATRLKNGEDFVKVYDEFSKIDTEESTDDTAEAEEPDPKKYETIVYEGMYSYYSYPEGLISEAVAMNAGEVIVSAEYNNYVFVVLKTDILESDDYKENYKKGSLIELKRDEFLEMIEQYSTGLSVEKNQKAIDRYDPKKIIDRK